MKKNNSIISLKKIFDAALKRVDPLLMMNKVIYLKGSTLWINTGTEKYSLSLNDYKNIYVIGMGKASARMAKALEAILGKKITSGIVATKYGHLEKLKYIKIMECGHPVPDDNSVKSGKAVIELLKNIDKNDLVINLISGGGSAIMCSPYFDDKGNFVTLEDKQALSKLLLKSGADIHEINCIRKHLSNLKGGRLAELIYPAQLLNLILSDVVGDDLDSIASGPAVADTTTFTDATNILKKYKIDESIPENIKKIFSLGVSGKIPDTPKKNNKIFKNVINILIGTNLHALLSAKEETKVLGLTPIVLTSTLTGEAKEIASFFFALGTDAYSKKTFGKLPVCFIAGGETTVTIKGSGLGGRNQEMALAFLCSIAKKNSAGKKLFFLSAGTDGTDGPTDAAGAFATYSIYNKAKALTLNPQTYIANNDSYHFFEKTGGLLKTGATGTNVCDIQLLIVEP